jgi:hypothetical protein
MVTQEKVDRIRTREDFVEFVYDLLDDLEAAPPASYWRNRELPAYLDAVAEWTECRLDDYLEERGEPAPAQPSWRIFAEILLSAAMREPSP